MLVCTSILFFLSISSGKDLCVDKQVRTRERGGREGGREGDTHLMAVPNFDVLSVKVPAAESVSSPSPSPCTQQRLPL